MEPSCRLHGQGWQFGRNAALPSGVRRRRNPPRRAHGFRRKYHRPFGVVSKCALREKREAPFGKKEKRPGFPERSQLIELI